ncbi:MAG: tRNA (guanosine(46)-N7)-methyltransferase TrmB [bacterium]|nr:tRNA (guanosine(46)-N7)-methyltransferase TrmB [bacterium]
MVNNPYRGRAAEFPGRLFNFPDGEADVDISAQLAEAEHTYLEFGSGSGGHLIDRALLQPDAGFWGFELRYKRAVRTVEKAQVRGAENVFVLRTRAESAEKFFPNHSIAGIYVNFADPWAKQKQHKHRLMNEQLLNSAHRLLSSDGFLAVKTDHEEYFDYFLERVECDERFVVQEFSRDLHNSDYLSDNVMTEFEKLFTSQGMPVFYVRLSRRSV